MDNPRAHRYVKNMFIYLRHRKEQEGLKYVQFKKKSPEGNSGNKKYYDFKHKIEYKLEKFSNITTPYLEKLDGTVIEKTEENKQTYDELYTAIEAFLQDNNDNDIIDKIIRNLLKITDNITDLKDKINFMSKKLHRLYYD